MFKNRYNHDNEYLDLVENVLTTGVQKGDRTGTGTISTFAQQMRFPLWNDSLPLLTTKQMHTHSIIHELLWFLAGDTNIKYLNDNNVRIWNEWADENGDLGPVYGAQWRNWTENKITGETHNCVNQGIHGEPYQDMSTTFDTKVQTTKIDQIADVIDKLRNNPNDRRIIVSAWNVGQIAEMRLPPCHLLFQFWSRELNFKQRKMLAGTSDCTVEDIPERALSCHLYQRSCDVGLGVPFNIAQYSILVHMIAQVTNHVAEEFVWTGGDTHIYNNHIEELIQQMKRKPYISPMLKLNKDITEIDDFTFEDFEVVNYKYHPTIKMEVSV